MSEENSSKNSKKAGMSLIVPIVYKKYEVQLTEKIHEILDAYIKAVMEANNYDNHQKADAEKQIMTKIICRGLASDRTFLEANESAKDYILKNKG